MELGLVITVHHLDNSRSQRVLWLLEELGLPYRVVQHWRNAATRFAPASLAAIHPLGKAPVIEAEGLTIAETGAIVEYLLESVDEGAMQPPRGTAAYRRCRYWLHYAEGSAMAPLSMRLLFDYIESAPVFFLVRPVVRGLARNVKGGYLNPLIGRHLDHMEAGLAEGPWFAGEHVSIADVMMSFPVQVAEALGLLGERPGLRQFLRGVEARPAWQRALVTGGGYALPMGTGG